MALSLSRSNFRHSEQSADGDSADASRPTYAQNDGFAGDFRQHSDVQAKNLDLLSLRQAEKTLEQDTEND
jgi:hypothetical protein